MKILILFLFCSAALSSQNNTINWDYFLFVQYWPGSWLYSDHNNHADFNNTYFNIHGLWPEYKNGSWPQYCNISKFNITKLYPIKQQLMTYWSNYKHPESFCRQVRDCI